jgi:predicted RNA-binding protein with PUA-like domain
MQKNDKALIYHSNSDKAIIGTAKIIKEAFPDKTSTDEGWVAVEVTVGKKLKKPVTLFQIKADSRLKDIGLVRNSRLSVIPLSEQEYEIITEMGS